MLGDDGDTPWRLDDVNDAGDFPSGRGNERLDLGAEQRRMDHHSRQHARQLHVQRIAFGPVRLARTIEPLQIVLADQLPVGGSF